MRALLLAQEKNLAYRRGIGTFEVTYANDTIANGFASDHAFENAVKRIVAERAEKQRMISTHLCFRRPIDQLRKVKKKSRFHAIFVRRLCLKHGRGAAYTQREEQRQRGEASLQS